MNRLCPQCKATLTTVWLYGDIEMGRCLQCGEMPLATVYQGPLTAVESVTNYEVTAVDDFKSDFLLRVSRLVPEYNVVQLKGMQVSTSSRGVIRLGIRTNSIDLPSFLKRVEELCLTVEIQPAGPDSTSA